MKVLNSFLLGNFSDQLEMFELALVAKDENNDDQLSKVRIYYIYNSKESIKAVSTLLKTEHGTPK